MQLSKGGAERSDPSRRSLLRLSGGLLVLATSLSFGGARQAHAAPAAKLWARWQAHDPASTATIDHTPWGDFLSHYLVVGADGINRVAYGQVSTEDHMKLGWYIDNLAALPISTYGRAEQMAFWVNLYNALTVQVVIDHYPVDSIREIDISPGLFSDGPWGKKLIAIEGEQVALDDIEHQILRPIWQDPRIHYAVNCASLGCPNLLPQPFTADTLDQQLDRAAVDFINHDRAVSIVGQELNVSSIYNWFGDDFGGGDQAIIAHLRRYASPELAKKLRAFSAIDDDRYDWRLNDADSLQSNQSS